MLHPPGYNPYLPGPRTRRWLAIITVPLVAGGIAAYVWYARDAEARLAAASQQAGSVWRLDNLENARPQVVEGRNAALAVETAARKLPADFAAKVAETLPTWPAPGPKIAPADADRVAQLLTPHPVARGTARNAIYGPSGRYPVAYSRDYFSTEYPSAEAARIALLLDLDGLDAVARNDQAAHVCGLALLHTARSIGDEPSAASQCLRADLTVRTVAYFERLLSAVEWDDAALADWQKKFDAEGQYDAGPTIAAGVRAGCDRVFAEVAGGRLDPGLLPDAGGRLQALFPGAFARRRATALERCNTLVDLAARPPKPRAAAVAEWAADVSALPLPARRTARDLPATFATLARGQAAARCLVVAVAAERHRKDHGEGPKAVADLVKQGKLAAAVVDPLTDEPLTLAVEQGILAVRAGTSATVRVWPRDAKP